MQYHRHYIDGDVNTVGEHSHEVKGSTQIGGLHNHQTLLDNARYSHEQATGQDYAHTDDNRRERMICVTNGDNKNMKNDAGTSWDELIFNQLVTNNHGGHTHNVDLHSYPGGAHAHEIKTFTQHTGVGGAHENRPPYYALLYIMKT